MRVAFATCSAMPGGSRDDHEAAAALDAAFPVWDDPAVDWSAFDRVVLRSVWDYSSRLPEFLAWCDRVGAERLRNPPALVRWNADKRYLGDVDAATVPTWFVDPGRTIPDDAWASGEIVVKPNVSAGARSTGRFERDAAADAVALVEAIHARGLVALVQPYLRSVEDVGETALVYLGGALSHVLSKRAVLRTPGIAPVAAGELAVAAVMLEDDLVIAGEASPAQRAFADGVIAEIAARFGVPLYARVDIIPGPGGAPVLLELEVIEPALYLATATGACDRLVAAVQAS